MPKISEAFGRKVSRVFDQKGWSLRAGTIATGIDYNTLNNMKAGIVPIRDKVIRWAEGIKSDINFWLQLVGYDPISPELVGPQPSAVREAGVGYVTETELMTVVGDYLTDRDIMTPAQIAQMWIDISESKGG